MPDLMLNKLGAYLDGQLGRREKTEVETHLETCQSCRDELDELRRLSYLLRAAPQPEFTSALDFKAQLMLQLPRRDETLNQEPDNHLVLWMAPVVVLAVWIFIQVTLGLSTLLLLAKQAGFLDGAAAWLASAPQQMLWFTTAQATVGHTLGTESLTGLSILNNADLFLQNLGSLLLWQVGVAVFYWGAMALVMQNKVKTLWASFTTG